MAAIQLVLVATLAVAGGQGAAKPESPQPTVQQPELVPPARRPYSGIFHALPQNPLSQLPAVPLAQGAFGKSQPHPRVVCGTVVVPVQPDVDTKMIVRLQGDPSREYRIRKIAPQMCNE